MRQDESGGGEWDWTPFAYYDMEEVGDGGYGWRLGCMDWVADIDGGTFTGYRWWLWVTVGEDILFEMGNE